MLEGRADMIDASIPEPQPVGHGQKVLPFVLDQLRRRAEMGKAKYGDFLKIDNGRDAIMDAYQELLDLTMYLGQAILEREERRKKVGYYYYGDPTKDEKIHPIAEIIARHLSGIERTSPEIARRRIRMACEEAAEFFDAAIAQYQQEGTDIVIGPIKTEGDEQ